MPQIHSNVLQRGFKSSRGLAPATHPPKKRGMQFLAPQARSAARVTLVVCCICAAPPEDAFVSFEFACVCLLVDFLVMCALCDHSLQPRFDEHAPAFTVGLSRLLAVVRSDGDLERDAQTRSLVEIGWCLSSLTITLLAKQLRAKRGLLYSAFNAELLVMIILLPAPCNSCCFFLARAVLFQLLSAALYAYLPEYECLIGPRGYLVCFLPVLFVSFSLAVEFSFLALAAVVAGDLAALEEWPKPVVHAAEQNQPVQVI